MTMTGIPSVVGSLKKNRSVVEELASSMQKEMAIILNEIDRLQEWAAELQEAWEEKQTMERELIQNVSLLEEELSTESREKTRLESTSVAQQKVLVDAKAEEERLKKEVIMAQKNLENLEDQLRSLERTIRENKKSIQDIEEQFDSVDSKFAETLQEYETKALEAANEAELQDAKYKAIRYLLREKIITTPEAKVAMELLGKETSTIDHLQKTTFIGRIKVKEILEKMAEQKIIKFDKSTGEVKILKPIDL